MFSKADYIKRGLNLVNNKAFPTHKRISSLMIYATDLCDSACKHCLIWAKRPPKHLSLNDIRLLMKSKCIYNGTSVGLEGGEFLLHPEADEILAWFANNHRNYDLFSNCLAPERLIEAVNKHKPKRLYLSLDGTEDTYRHMRGKDGYNRVLKVIESLKDKVPLFVMFTLSPYNDFEDLEHVAQLCKANNVFLRVGIYNNIPFFDTIDNAKVARFGELKHKPLLSFKEVKQLQMEVKSEQKHPSKGGQDNLVSNETAIPSIVKQFRENFDYIQLYNNWKEGELRLRCHSILDSVVILPDGSVPICQNLDLMLGNIHQESLDAIFNSAKTVKTQKHYSENCNQCWVSFHRKYDVALYRTFEKFFGRNATVKMLGYYKWCDNETTTYKDLIK